MHRKSRQTLVAVAVCLITQQLLSPASVLANGVFVIARKVKASQTYTTVHSGKQLQCLVVRGRPAYLSLFAFDLDSGDPLSIQLNDTPAGLRFDSATRRLSWFPQSSDIGRHIVDLVLNDGLVAAEYPIVLEVLSALPYSDPTDPQQIFFVDGTSGNDNDDGQTLSSAWRTIAKAAGTLTAGQMALIRGGDYYEWTSVTHSGTVSEPIILKGYQGENVVMHGKNPDSSSVKYDGSPEAFNLNSGVSHIVIDGLEMRDFSETVYLRGDNNDVRLLNLEIYNAASYGIYGGGNSVRIENSIVQNAGDRGIALNATNLHVYNSRIDSATDRGMSLSGGRGSNTNVISSEISGCSVGLLTSADTSIIDSEIHHNLAAGIDSRETETLLVNARVHNNPVNFNVWFTAMVINSILVGGNYGIYFPHSPLAVTVFNSIFAQNGIADIHGNSSVTVVEDYNLFGTQVAQGTHSQVADPEFVNAAAGDYHLQPGSPGIDHGLSIEWMIRIDSQGQGRPQGLGWDIGPYEQ